MRIWCLQARQETDCPRAGLCSSAMQHPSTPTTQQRKVCTSEHFHSQDVVLSLQFCQHLGVRSELGAHRQIPSTLGFSHCHRSQGKEGRDPAPCSYRSQTSCVWSPRSMLPFSCQQEDKGCAATVSPPVAHTNLSEPGKTTSEAYGFSIQGLFTTMTNRKHL